MAANLYERAYAKQARKLDKEGHGQRADLTAQRACQDVALADQQRQFSLQAQDRTPKSARHHWAVVGEGSPTSQMNYRRNYDNINWKG